MYFSTKLFASRRRQGSCSEACSRFCSITFCLAKKSHLTSMLPVYIFEINHLSLCILGSDEERGMLKWRSYIVLRTRVIREDLFDVYDVPLVTTWFAHHSWSRYVPFLPTFNEDLCACNFCFKQNKVGPEVEYLTPRKHSMIPE